MSSTRIGGNPQLGAISTFTGATPNDYSLDPYGGLGLTFRGKPILDLAAVINQIDSGSSIAAHNGTITFSFLTTPTTIGVYNNPVYGFPEPGGYSPFSDDQKAAAREALQLWDDLIPQQFVEKTGLGADIVLANTTTGPAQAWTYYPGHGYKFQGDVWTATPSDNWSNDWFEMGGYGNTTLIHELGHAIGLSHPGAYNYDPDVTQDYSGLAEYAQDSMQYSIMSYWSGRETNALTVNWSLVLNNYAQTPMVHDILTIQSIYGIDTTTRTGDTIYGFNSNAARDVFDFAANPFPYLSIYDAGGNDTIDLSGFSASQFINLHPGSFSSIGAAIPSAAAINANLDDFAAEHGIIFGHVSQALVNSLGTSYMNAAESRIASYTGVHGIYATEYDNFSIAYGVTIENAIGGSARDLLWGNDVANVLNGMGGDDVLRGFGGNDTFVFANDASTDTIADFQTGADKIDLTAISGVTAADVSYNSTTHQLQIDTNHDATYDMFINVLGTGVATSDILFHA